MNTDLHGFDSFRSVCIRVHPWLISVGLQLALLSVSVASAQQPVTSETLRGTLLAPKAFRAAADKALPSLVTIEGFGGLAAGSGIGKGIHAPGEGPTTGVVLSSDGYIVTSTYNFLRKPPVITVRFANGQRKVAKLLGQDKTRKICVLKVEGVSGLVAPEFAPREELHVGQWVVALGIGFGDNEPALTAGIISAASRISAKAIQTDANLSPANYGGPLIDLDGRVVGICVPLSPGGKQEGAGSEWYDSGIGFAVPLYGLDNVIAALKEGKTLEPAFLGVQTQATGTPSIGAIIQQVLAGSPAEKAGLKVGDDIVSVGGTRIIDVGHLSVVIGRYVAGDKVELVVLRGEEELTVSAELAVAPAQTTPMPNPFRPGETPKPEPEKPAPNKSPNEDK
ncbi:MAG TPA: trypsin-like peptidase domain-containing protein [Pirellulaceae bacterium]|nr:trypsin-like peptidase domain-containing protein [Pirellulaceae bacterium]